MFAANMRFQLQYFNRNIIRTRWPKFNKDPLMHAGNLVMRIARSSIKRRSKLRGKPSRPGTPPRSRQPGSLPPFKMVFSVPFHLGTSVAVGMVGFHNGAFGPPVPGLHEHGGMATRFTFQSQGQRRRKSGRFGKRRVTYKRRMTKYPERPFMWPALLKARQRLPRMWLNSISRG